MKTKMLAAGVMAAMLALTACEEPSSVGQSQPKNYDVESIIRDTHLTPTQKAEKLAEIGEALATPVGFMFADEVLTQALKFDSNNLRAQLYKHIVAPAMKLKGALRGVRPLIGKMSGATQNNFETTAMTVNKNVSLHGFLVAGPADITNEEKAQQLLDQVYAEQDKIRLFMRGPFKRNTLNISPVVMKGPIEQYLADCQVTPVNPMNGYHQKYEVSACPWARQYTTTIDSADIEVLQHAFAGLEIATILATSYDATGGVAYEVYARNRATTADRIRFINQLPHAGQLRANSSITRIYGMASDAYAGAQWARQYQDRLCPYGHNKINRPGRLFSGGLCVQDHPNPKYPKADAVMRVISAALAGTAINIGLRDEKLFVTDLSKESNFEYRTTAQVFAPIRKPVTNLKALLPTVFDACGNPLNVGDSTLGGLLPEGNANDVAARLGKFRWNCPR